MSKVLAVIPVAATQPKGPFAERTNLSAPTGVFQQRQPMVETNVAANSVCTWYEAATFLDDNDAFDRASLSEGGPEVDGFVYRYLAGETRRALFVKPVSGDEWVNVGQLLSQVKQVVEGWAFGYDWAPGTSAVKVLWATRGVAVERVPAVIVPPGGSIAPPDEKVGDAREDERVVAFTQGDRNLLKTIHEIVQRALD